MPERITKEISKIFETVLYQPIKQQGNFLKKAYRKAGNELEITLFLENADNVNTEICIVLYFSNT